MKIAVDTNVVVSAFISKMGQPAALLNVALTFAEMEILLSDEILEEFRNVLLRQEVRERFEYTEDDVSGFIETLRHAVTIVTPVSGFKVVREYPDDDIVINTAFDGEADYIVSGDRHLRNVKRFKNILIVSPKSMLDVIVRRFGETALGE